MSNSTVINPAVDTEVPKIIKIAPLFEILEFLERGVPEGVADKAKDKRCTAMLFKYKDIEWIALKGRSMTYKLYKQPVLWCVNYTAWQKHAKEPLKGMDAIAYRCECITRSQLFIPLNLPKGETDYYSLITKLLDDKRFQRVEEQPAKFYTFLINTVMPKLEETDIDIHYGDLYIEEDKVCSVLGIEASEVEEYIKQSILNKSTIYRVKLHKNKIPKKERSWGYDEDGSVLEDMRDYWLFAPEDEAEDMFDKLGMSEYEGNVQASGRMLGVFASWTSTSSCWLDSNKDLICEKYYADGHSITNSKTVEFAGEGETCCYIGIDKEYVELWIQALREAGELAEG